MESGQFQLQGALVICGGEGAVFSESEALVVVGVSGGGLDAGLGLGESALLMGDDLRGWHDIPDALLALTALLALICCCGF
jgi:hypothetical protein